MKRTTILLIIVVAAAIALGMRKEAFGVAQRLLSYNSKFGVEAFGPVDPYFWPNTHAHWYGGQGGVAMQPRLGLQRRADPYF